MKPMLAHKYVPKKHECKGMLAQPKLDGVRCVAVRTNEDTIEPLSRNGNKFNLPHLSKQLDSYLTGGDMVDGELYIPGVPFEEIVGIVKTSSKVHERANDIEYHVFDYVDNPSEPYIDRITTFSKKMVRDIQPNIKLVSSGIVASPNHLEKLHQYHIKCGYEGTILRDSMAPYEFDKRSNYILKYKDWIDAEFPIVDVVSGKGKEDGLAVFVCEIHDGKTFRVRPRGSYKMREGMLLNKGTLVGRLLTVRYQRLSQGAVSKDIPIFPVGISVRDYE